MDVIAGKERDAMKRSDNVKSNALQNMSDVQTIENVERQHMQTLKTECNIRSNWSLSWLLHNVDSSHIGKLTI